MNRMAVGGKDSTCFFWEHLSCSGVNGTLYAKLITTQDAHCPSPNEMMNRFLDAIILKI